MSTATRMWQALLWRRKRQMRIARAWRKRRELRAVQNRTSAIGAGDVLCFVTVRNEMQRLPHFLAHYRALGVAHFLMVDNASDDGSAEYLARQSDVSLWHTKSSYRAARFGMDWLQGLLMRYGHGHWCVTVDADELLIYPHHQTRPLSALGAWLEEQGEVGMGALMLDLFPRGPLSETTYAPGDDPTQTLCWYDDGNYTIQQKPDTKALWIQGGPRARAFFSETPERAPTLTKLPFVKWNWRYVYTNSTHVMLPRHLNHIFDADGGEKLSGVLLHTKFLPNIAEKSAEEKTRRQHFGEPGAFDGYYDALIASPDLWHPYAARYRGWRQLETEGLMSRGGWG